MEPVAAGEEPEHSGDAAIRVFAITELAEAILELLPPRDLLISQRVCRQFRDVFQASKALKQKLHIIPHAKANALEKMPVYPSFLNNNTYRLLVHNGQVNLANVSFYGTFEPQSEDASWRSMQICSPPMKSAVVFATKADGLWFRGPHGNLALARVCCKEGLTLGQIADAAIHARKKFPGLDGYHFRLSGRYEA